MIFRTINFPRIVFSIYFQSFASNLTQSSTEMFQNVAEDWVFAQKKTYLFQKFFFYQRVRFQSILISFSSFYDRVCSWISDAFMFNLRCKMKTHFKMSKEWNGENKTEKVHDTDLFKALLILVMCEILATKYPQEWFETWQWQMGISHAREAQASKRCSNLSPS